MAHIALAVSNQEGRAGVEIAEFCDEPDYVSVKCRDRDGYIIELAWEP